MLRTYLVIIVVIGLAASLLNSTKRTTASPAGRNTLVVDAATPGPEPSNQTVANLEDGSVQLQRNENGYFYADVDINGAQVHMLVDTGATGIALSRDDARKAGIATSIGMNDVVGEGADGSIHGEYVTIDRMSLGGKSVDGMRAIVLNNGEQSLLGQSFLAQFASVEMHGDTMTLR
jgi:aspartyl protease family protein